MTLLTTKINYHLLYLVQHVWSIWCVWSIWFSVCFVHLYILLCLVYLLQFVWCVWPAVCLMHLAFGVWAFECVGSGRASMVPRSPQTPLGRDRVLQHQASHTSIVLRSFGKKVGVIWSPRHLVRAFLNLVEAQKHTQIATSCRYLFPSLFFCELALCRGVWACIVVGIAGVCGSALWGKTCHWQRIAEL